MSQWPGYDNAYSGTRFILVLPTANDVPTVGDAPDNSHATLANRLQAFAPSRARGRNIIKENGEYTTVDHIPTARAALAEKVYWGGHHYELTEVEKEELEAAGYTVLVEE